MFVDPVGLCGNCTNDPEYALDVEVCDLIEDSCCIDTAWDWPLSPNGTHITHKRGEEGKAFNLDWMYYGGYHWHTGLGAPGTAGYEEGLRIDAAYVMVVLGLYVVNIVAVIRELAANVVGRVKSQSEEKIESMRFTLTKELFGGYQHGLATSEAIEAHLSGLRNDLKTIMGQKFEKRFTGHQNYVLHCIPEMTARRYAGQMGAFILIVITGVALTICIGFRKELDEINKAYQPLILTLVKQVIPLLVKKTVAIEKYVDAEKAMKATVQRVYFLKMFSLVNIFYNNLNELTNEDDTVGLLAISVANRTYSVQERCILHPNPSIYPLLLGPFLTHALSCPGVGTCVESELGRAYLRLIMMDMLVGAIKEFILYPKWRIKVRLDRSTEIRKTLVIWLTNLGMEDKEAALRKFMGQSFFEATNIEHIREMDVGQEQMSSLKTALMLSEGQVDEFKKAVLQLKNELAEMEPDVAARPISMDTAQEDGGDDGDADLGLEERVQGGGGADDEAAESADNPLGDDLGALEDLEAGGDDEDGGARPLPETPLQASLPDAPFEAEKTEKERKKEAKEEAKEAKRLKKKEQEMQKRDEMIKKANAPRMARGGLDATTLDLIEERNKTEYDTDRAAQAAIDMMYRQSLIWVGASLCPMLPFAGLVNISIQFFVQYNSMFKSCKPPKTPWSAEKTMYFFMQLVLLALLISGAPIVVLLTSKKISCGPHCSQAAMAQRAPWLLDSMDSNRCNPILSGADYQDGVETWITSYPFGDEPCWDCQRSSALCIEEGGQAIANGGTCRDCDAEGYSTCTNEVYQIEWDDRPCTPIPGEKDGTCLKSITNPGSASTTCQGQFCNDEYTGPAFVGAADRWMADKTPLLQETIGAVIRTMLTAETMFSILFVSSIAIYFQAKVSKAMAAQIDAMGVMLTDEEKERYEIIQTNLAQG